MPAAFSRLQLAAALLGELAFFCIPILSDLLSQNTTMIQMILMRHVVQRRKVRYSPISVAILPHRREQLLQDKVTTWAFLYPVKREAWVVGNRRWTHDDPGVRSTLCAIHSERIVTMGKRRLKKKWR